MDLQHGRGLRLAHAVLRRAGVRALVLLPHAEQAEAVAVADLKPGGDNRGEIRGRWRRSGRSGDSSYRSANENMQREFLSVSSGRAGGPFMASGDTG